MRQAARAIYEDGQLRLLDAVKLENGQSVRILIVSEHEMVRVALGDLVLQPDGEPDDAPDDEAGWYRELMEQTFAETRPLSEIIIEERDMQM
jgi:predicted DNA-binding antitoxin AbrB/MazE fold protein